MLRAFFLNQWSESSTGEEDRRTIAVGVHFLAGFISS